ncbi:hypothetical protein BgiMline_027437, partial [Biomphalaria glabrata]
GNSSRPSRHFSLSTICFGALISGQQTTVGVPKVINFPASLFDSGGRQIAEMEVLSGRARVRIPAILKTLESSPSNSIESSLSDSIESSPPGSIESSPPGSTESSPPGSTESSPPDSQWS